jgi:hypothetical protein
MGAQIRPLQPLGSPESALTSVSTSLSPGAHASHPFLASDCTVGQAPESPLRAVPARISVPHEFLHSPSTKFVLEPKAKEVRSAPSGPQVGIWHRRGTRHQQSHHPALSDAPPTGDGVSEWVHERVGERSAAGSMPIHPTRLCLVLAEQRCR